MPIGKVDSSDRNVEQRNKEETGLFLAVGEAKWSAQRVHHGGFRSFFQKNVEGSRTRPALLIDSGIEMELAFSRNP
jgi:hypothetical protein